MQNCPSTRTFHTLALGIGALFLVIAATPIASAQYYSDDYNYGYTTMPGQECHHWNRYGECSDWSSYDTGRALPGSFFPNGVTSTYQRCQSPMLDCTGRVTIRARAVPAVVRRGNYVTYTLYLRNDDSQMRTVYVRAFLDEYMGFENGSNGYIADGRLVRWDNLRMEPWSSKMLMLRVRIDTSAPYDAQLKLLTQAGNTSDTATIRVEDTRDEDNVRFPGGAQYYPYGATSVPLYRKPEHDNRNYYYIDGVMEYRAYGRVNTAYPYRSGDFCDKRYFSCEKRP